MLLDHRQLFANKPVERITDGIMDAIERSGDLAQKIRNRGFQDQLLNATATDKTQTEATEKAQVLNRFATKMKGLPPELRDAALTQAAPILNQFGVDGVDVSDQGLDTLINSTSAFVADSKPNVEKLGQGDMLLVDGKPVAFNPKPEKTTDDITEYNLAKTQGFEGSFTDFLQAKKSDKGGVAVDDFIGTPVRIEREGKTYLAGMVQTPKGSFEVREVALDGELTDTSGRTPQEQIDDKTRTKALEIALDKSGKAFDRLEGINTNIANLREVVSLVEQGANTGKLQNKLPSFKEASIKLRNLQNRLGIDVIGAVTFGALSKDEMNLALETALPSDLDEDDLADWAKTKIAAQEKLRDAITEFAQFTGSGDKTIADWLEHKKQNPTQNSETSTDVPEITTQEQYDALPSGAIYTENGQQFRKP